MFFLNLTAAEFIALFGILGGFITAIYLLDRTKRKKIVSTLRFWAPAFTAEEQRSRKRVREPWSLVLQLLSLLLLLLAIAQLQWGTRARSGRDHVLLLDTSSLTAQKDSHGTVLDLEKTTAARYAKALPAGDRIMLVRVDGLATPVSSFTSDRNQILNAIAQSTAEFSALNIEQALSFARQAQSWSGGRQGEIVYIGPGWISGKESTLTTVPDLRTILVPSDGENCGIRRIGVKRNESDANSWQAIATLKNYGSKTHTVRLLMQFAGTRFAPRTITLHPREETAAEYNFVTSTAGKLIAAIEPHDMFTGDDRAVLELPRNGLLRLAVFTTRPDALKPLLEANHQISARFFRPEEYAAKPAADVMLLDRMAAPHPPLIASLWIDPPKEGSPSPVKSIVNDAVIKAWQSSTSLGTGLRAREARIPAVKVFQTFEGDIAVGSISEGPAVIARPSSASRPSMALIGFDPLTGPLRFEVTTPLLFANLLRWLSPEAFRTIDIAAGQAGLATVTLDPDEDATRIRVTDESGFEVPFTVRERNLELFASRPSIVRIASENRERVLSLTLPDVAEFQWTPSARAVGLPPRAKLLPAAIDLWQWLAVLGGLGLLVEWILYGRNRLKTRQVVPASGRRPAADAAPQRELVSK